MIFGVNFSNNCENKQKNEIQSAYFDHEAFTLYNAACYFKKEFASAKRDSDYNLYKLPVVIVSNKK